MKRRENDDLVFRKFYLPPCQGHHMPIYCSSSSLGTGTDSRGSVQLGTWTDWAVVTPFGIPIMVTAEPRNWHAGTASAGAGKQSNPRRSRTFMALEPETGCT